jgi:ABC-type phosphate transport system auxiliary subunit
MTRAFLFWLIFVLAVLAYFGLIFFWAEPGYQVTWRTSAPNLIDFILIGLLGWGVYGPPIKG